MYYLVCQTDDACTGFPLAGGISDFDEPTIANMTCYKGGQTVFNNHQMCDVTSTLSREHPFSCSNLFYKIVKSLICFLIDPHRSPLTVTAPIKLALSSFGQHKSSHSTAHWNNALLRPLENTIATPPATPAKKFSAAAFQAVSSVERMAVSVRTSLFQKKTYL